jgi:hypothetical protein
VTATGLFGHVAEVSSAAKLVRGFDVDDSLADLESSGSSQVQHSISLPRIIIEKEP